MKLKILELASFEIEDARQYYNLQQAKLGDRVAHQRREPDYWVD